MKIILLVKQVPETSATRIDPETGTVIRRAADAIVNPLDLHAVEAALQLRQRYGGTIVAISMGPASAIVALREVIAMGVDEAALVSDRAYAGADTWATSFILSHAIKYIAPDFDLILCGLRATDGETGQVGPEVAAALDIPAMTYVTEITDYAEPNRLCVKTTTEDGTATLLVEGPALLAVDKSIASPRLPTLSGKLKAKRANVPVLTQSELRLPCESVGLAGSPTRIVKVFRPRWSREGTLLRPTDPDTLRAAVHSLDELLARKGLK